MEQRYDLMRKIMFLFDTASDALNHLRYQVVLLDESKVSAYLKNEENEPVYTDGKPDYSSIPIYLLGDIADALITIQRASMVIGMADNQSSSNFINKAIIQIIAAYDAFIKQDIALLRFFIENSLSNALAGMRKELAAYINPFILC